MRNKFHTNCVRDRWVTIYGCTYKEVNGYALGCGYATCIESKNQNQKLELYREHGHLQVRYIDRDRTPTSDESKNPWIMDRSFYMEWHTFDNAAQAKKKFKELLKTYKNLFRG